MAYTTVANVRKASANADTIPGPNMYHKLRVVNGANGANTITIKKTDNSGTIIWQSKVLAANEVEESEVDINLAAAIYITMAQTGGVLFLYSR